MKFKNEMIGEICDNAEYFEVLNDIDMTNEIDEKFEEYLNELSDEKLIEAFEYHCYDYDEFLEGYELNELQND